MGKLVLTRRAGESVKLTEPNGDVWVLKVRNRYRTEVSMVVFKNDRPSEFKMLLPNESMTFAGGSVELRPARCPSQAILAFDFPRDVTILRTEIA